MSCKTESKTIDGVSYTITQKPPITSLPLKFRLLKVANKADLPELFAKAKDFNLEDPTADDLKVVVEALGSLIETADPNEITAILKELVVDGFRNDVRITELNFDEVFAGKLEEIYILAAFSIKVNWGNFLQGLMQKVKK